tara:strand:+ start:854 stop:1477 length:624 start_codon:yes stop_codon:yes gene_type:complete
MAYNNFIERIFVSVIFFSTYLLIFFYNFEFIFIFIIFIYLAIALEILKNFTKLKLIIFFYIVISFISLLNINLNNEVYIKFNLMVLIVITFDTFSYIVGILIGKYKFLPSISPKKTLEGTIGGFVLSLFISIIYSYFYDINLNIYFFYFVILIIVSAFFGDLIESYFKRKNNLKNSSNFLPGHGGFFDRFDSYILSLMMYSFINHII